MASSVNSQLAPLTAPLLAFLTVASFVATLSLVGLYPWLAASLLLLGVGRILVSLQGSAWQVTVQEGERRRISLTRLFHALRANPASAGIALHGLAIASLTYTAFAATAGIVDSLEIGIAERDSGPSPYSAAFGSLAWLSLAAIATITAVRVTTYLYPNLAAQWPLPWGRLAMLAAAYPLLADGGMVSRALDAPTAALFLAVTLGVAGTYIANAVRPIAESSESPNRRWFARAALAATGGHPSVLLLFGLVLAAPLTGSSENGGDGYGGAIDSLAAWSLLLIFPMYTVRRGATKWSIISALLPSPIAHSAAFVISIILFDQTGILTTIYEYPSSGLASAAIAAILLTYAAWVLRRTVRLEYEFRFRGILNAALAPASSVLIALGATLPLLALLSDAPVINALMLDYVETEEIGRLYQPYVAAIYETRSLIAFLFFIVALALTLPQAVWSLPRWEARPLVSAVGFAFAGCLAWLLGLAMADLGYGYALGGSVAGAGFFSVAITQMGLQFSGDSNSIVADSIRWMAESKTRSFMPGAAIAIYALLLRPIIYDTLALAAVLEWLALLAAIVGVILRMRSRLQTDINVVETGAAPTVDWSRHQQHLETLPDPRTATVYNVRQAWIQVGDPSGVWTYMMGLLCRGGAPPDSVRHVMSPLRESSARKSPKDRYDALTESFAANRVTAGSTNTAENYTGSLRELNELAADFVESGDDADVFAAYVTAAYSLRGGNVGRAVNLCFHLTHDETTRRGAGSPLTRGRTRRRMSERRERLIRAVLEHLAGERDILALPIAVLASPVEMYRTPAAALNMVSPITTILAGQAVEILADTGAALSARAPDGTQGYIATQLLERHALLPRDEAVLRAGRIMRLGTADQEISDDWGGDPAGDDQREAEHEGEEITA